MNEEEDEEREEEWSCREGVRDGDMCVLVDIVDVNELAVAGDTLAARLGQESKSKAVLVALWRFISWAFSIKGCERKTWI